MKNRIDDKIVSIMDQNSFNLYESDDYYWSVKLKPNTDRPYIGLYGNTIDNSKCYKLIFKGSEMSEDINRYRIVYREDINKTVIYLYRKNKKRNYMKLYTIGDVEKGIKRNILIDSLLV